jgi:hypothetical protein
MDEQQAIQRLKRGDIGGLEILVNVYQVRAVRTAYLITRDVALAEYRRLSCKPIAPSGISTRIVHSAPGSCAVWSTRR